MKKILVTGFEAFHGQSINPSQKIIENLKACENLKTLLLPVHFENAFQLLKSTFVAEQNFEALLMLGQALSRSSIELERVALNWVKTHPMHQNSNTIQNGRIHSQGPDAYLNPWIREEWLTELNQIGPSKISLSAGDYVCNYIYYQSIRQLTQNKIPTLFVHLPGLPEQMVQQNSKTPAQIHSVEFDQQLRVIQKIIEKMTS